MTRPLITGLRSALVWVVVLLAGCATRVPAPRPPELAAREAALGLREKSNLRVFDAVWDLVQRKYYDPKFHGVDWPAAALQYAPRAVAAPDDTQLYAVLNEMIGELKESHNWASTAKERAENPEAPSARLGFVLNQVEGKWMVLSVVPGSPAAEAGVKEGWILVSRNGQPLRATPDFELKAGESVTDVYLDAADQPHTLTMTARPVSTTAYRHARMLEGGVVYLRFDDFNRPSRRWLSDQLKLHREAPGVVIDLRNNPGGELMSLDITIGEFFTKSVASGRMIDREGGSFDDTSWPWGSARYPGRVAGLTGSQSASCAEIFAHVLQYHRRAVVVGRPTAGAVIPATYYDLPDGGQLQLAIEDYRGLDGQRLEGVGVKPDIAVKSTYDGVAGLRAGRDRDIEAALAALKTEAGANRAVGAVGAARVGKAP